MSAINYAIREVTNRLPSQVLKRMFGKTQGMECSFNPTTIEDQIRIRVISHRVLTDMNIVGGRMKYLKLSQAQILHSDDIGTSYHYTEEQLHGRGILSAHYHMLGNPPTGDILMMANLQQERATTMENEHCNADAMNKKLTSLAENYKHKIVGFTGNVDIELVAKNTILVPARVTGGYFKVTLTDDPELTRVPPRSWRVFARLVELATKAYLYKEEVITLEQTEIYQGQALAGIKSYIDGLADSEELYQEQLTRWAKIAFMHDRRAYNNFLKSQISPDEYM